jgi:hypothetical protein
MDSPFYCYCLVSQVEVTLRPTVNQSVSFDVEPYLGFMTRYLLLFDSYGFCGAPSLTWGRVCNLYMLLVLASAVFLGSKSLCTRDHILLSQIWDFPFRRLLRLAESRWMYWTPPPHGSVPWFFSGRPLTYGWGILGDVRCLLISMDTPVDSAATSWFPRFYNFHSRIHGHACWFRSNEPISKILQFPFPYPWTRLLIPQQRADFQDSTISIPVSMDTFA